MKVFFGFHKLTKIVDAGYIESVDEVVAASLTQTQKDSFRETERSTRLYTFLPSRR